MPRGSGDKKAAVMNSIVEMIRTDRYPVGGRLPSERELVKQLGVGRNVLREALAMLVAKGYLEARERQGLFVRQADFPDLAGNLQNMQMLPDEFMPMQMEIRMIICVPATEIAALRRTEQDLARLWDCLERFENAPYETPEEEEAHGKWEALLHHLETEAAHNPFLSRVNEGISALIERNNAIMHHVAIQDRERFLQIMSQHRQIVEAIERRDPETAGRVQRMHLIETYELMKKNYPGQSGMSGMSSVLVPPFWERGTLPDNVLAAIAAAGTGEVGSPLHDRSV